VGNVDVDSHTFIYLSRDRT